jgi:hypothetical protein
LRSQNSFAEELSMNTTGTLEQERQELGFYSALVAASRAPEIPESADVYGWLVGSWQLDVVYYLADVRSRAIQGEMHCARVLEGRGIQDIWIMPQVADRTAKIDTIPNTYGTTLRVWEASIQAWRVTWVNPITGRRDELIGRRSHRDIVQLGTHADGTLIRWSFREITPDSFRWIGEALEPDGETWKLEAEFHAKRIHP